MRESETKRERGRVRERECVRACVLFCYNYKCTYMHATQLHIWGWLRSVGSIKL